MLLVKQMIDRQRPGRRLWALVSAAVMLCSAGAGAFLLQRTLRTMTATHTAAKAAPANDPLATIQGVWGWRADAAQSCAENPQTIRVSSDRRTLTVGYAKAPASAPRRELEFDVVSTQPNELVLSASTALPGRHQVSIFIKFLDADSYTASNSDHPLQTTGIIERCKQQTAGAG